MKRLSKFFLAVLLLTVTAVSWAACPEGTTQTYKGCEPVPIALDGGTYTGEVSNGMPDGQGTWTKGAHNYVGEWKDGKRHGQGIYTVDGSKILSESSLRSCLTRLSDADWTEEGYKSVPRLIRRCYQEFGKSTYVGEWKNGKRHGQGTYSDADGSTYVGEWKDSKRHGQGTFSSSRRKYSGFIEGDKYVGEWKGDYLWNGTVSDPDGTVTETYAKGICVGCFLKGKLSGASLPGISLIGENLTGFNLSAADMSNADLTGAILSNADLTGANLFKANMARANLSGANLRSTDLWGANLNKANLSGADLRNADLRKSNLTEAKLFGANLSEANLGWANLTKANLTGANLEKLRGMLKAIFCNTTMPDGTINNSGCE